MHNSLAARDKKVVWHPYTPQKYAPDPIAITRGEGVYLYDTNGNQYIDAISSWWVNLHGHGNKFIAGKIYEQAKTLEQVIFAGFTHKPAVDLAEKLVHILPGSMSKIFYSDNGSTAVEVAIKMSLQYWWNTHNSLKPGPAAGVATEDKRAKSHFARSKILAINNAYHGDTFGAMSVSERGVFTLAFQEKLFEVVFVDPMTLDQVDLSAAPHADQATLKIDPRDIACFIYEPLIQGAGGMKIFEAASLERFLQKLKAEDVICIADEVMTGFGRTGKLFASEYLQTHPDIICLSKGLTGGTMAMGVTACSEKIHNAFLSDDKRKTFFHGHSYTANPLACTAALASLELLTDESCHENIRRISSQHKKFLGELERFSSKGKNGVINVKNRRSIGTILAFEIEAGEDTYLNNISTIISQKSLQEGVLLRPLGNTVYIMPPYCITDMELQKVYETIVSVISQL